MARFEVGIDKLLEREGGYVNDPADPGGETKYGITKRDHPNEDIRNLTPARAAQIYHQEYWDPLRLGEIVDDGVAWKIMDMAVNMGRGTAANRAQRTVNYILPGTPLVVDGNLGPASIAAINQCRSRLMLLGLEAYAAARYIELVESPEHPQFDKFADGWLIRAMGPAL